MFTEMPYEERNCYAYQKNVLPYNPNFSQISYSSYSVKQKSLCVTGADRTMFFKNPLNNVRTINVGLMANEDENMSCNNMQFGITTTGVQTTFRYFYIL